MNDAEYLFKTDAAEKKRNGRGAFNKKGGSKSKKCTLPGDYLTPAQKKKLSKTIVDVNLREPMTWQQFKACSPDIQKEYLIFIRDRFHVSLGTIAIDLFGLNGNTIRNWINKEAPHLKGLFPKKRRPASDVRLDQWNLWLGKDISEAETSRNSRKLLVKKKSTSEEPFEIEKTDKFHTYKVVDIKIKDELPPEAVFDPVPNVDLDASSLSMTFDKTCSYEDICDKLKFVLMANANGRNVSHFEFTVKFESKGGDSNEEVSVSL